MPCEDRHTQGTGHVTTEGEMEDAAASQEPPRTSSNTRSWEEARTRLFSPESQREHHPASAFILDIALSTVREHISVVLNHTACGV